MNEEVIIATTEAIGKTDNWGVTAITIFFVLVFLGIVFFILVYAVKGISEVVRNNTNALQSLKSDISTDFKDVRKKQDEIHLDVKEILYNTKNKKDQ